MANDQFSLCWDNFHTNMSSGLNSLLKSEDLVDVTLAAEGRFLKAHKMVLSVCSPYFRELFQVNPCQHPIVFLKDVSYNVLSSLLEFMYQGEVKVSQDELATFIKTAEALKIKGLTGDGHNDVQNQPEMEPDTTPVTQQKTKISSESPITITSKPIREKSPLLRKKLLGPASKRFKTSNTTEFTQNPQIEHQSTETQRTEEKAAIKNDTKDPSLTITPLTTFKLEPNDNEATLANEEEITYDETAMEDIGMDNPGDYLMETTEEVKAGTSTDVTNNADDNQGKGLYKFVVTQLGTLNLVLHHHLYRPRNLIHGTERRLWICTWRDGHCPAKAISHDGKLVAKRGMHNHPPQREIIAIREAAGQICYRKLF